MSNPYSSTTKNIVIKKETITRLIHDVKHIMKNPLIDNGIYYFHDDEDILKGYAVIIGPKDTPYFAGNYFFEFNYPSDYPHSPPMVKYCTNGDNIRFNPNLYVSGKVCISILNTWRGEQWTSCQSISTILLTLCTLLCNNPLLNEPGVTPGHTDLEKYTKIIEYKNVEIAIMKMVIKHEGVYPTRFDIFYPYVKEQFLKNRKDIITYLEKKKAEISEPLHLTTGFYNLNVVVDYTKLYNIFLEKTKQFE